MNQTQWQDIRRYFSELSDLSTAVRVPKLESIRQQAPETARELDAMLVAHDALENAPVPSDLNFAATVPEQLGNCAIQNVIGQGGTSRVYRALHPIYGEVAVKQLPTHRDPSSNMHQRLKREVDILASVDHPGICRFYDAYISQDMAILIMEYIEGRTLESSLNVTHLSGQNAINIALDVAGALAAIHEKHIVHRDIKPSNIMLTPNGKAKLIDFGIAYVAATRLTATGDLLGSPVYMSPEQWRGDSLESKTDLWSLGVLLYHLCCGRPPFAGSNLLELSQQVLFHPPAPWQPTVSWDYQATDTNSSLPSRFKRANHFEDTTSTLASKAISEVKSQVTMDAMGSLVERLLNKDRNSRPKTAHEVSDCLRALIDRPS